MVPILAPVVEGHGEVPALPVLLRRVAAEVLGTPLLVSPPWRLGRSKMLDPKAIQAAYKRSAVQGPVSGVLILLDADDDCPRELSDAVANALGDIWGPAVEVVAANREYEAWFLAGVESLRGHRSILADANFPTDPEMPRGAKERLKGMMTESYNEMVHQVVFSSMVDLAIVYERSRSFRRLCSAVETLVKKAGA